MIKAILLAGVISVGLAAPAFAGLPHVIKVECPLDGVKFDFVTTMSHSTWGFHMDGKPVGSWTFPMPIPQCPGTRLPVVGGEYSAEQKAALNALVLTPEYKAIQNEASYYVLDFVLRKTGEQKPEGHVWMLLQSTWQVDEDPATYSRYAAELVEAMDNGLKREDIEEQGNWPFYQLSIANVQRQAGDFDGARQRLAQLGDQVQSDPELLEWADLTRTMIEAGDTSTRPIRERR